MHTRPTNKLELLRKEKLMPGERAGPIIRDQLFCTNKEKSQMDTLSISITWPLIYNLNKMLTGLIKRKMLLMKKLSTLGEVRNTSIQRLL